MIFVKTEELKEGMRLARPIYNHNGVLLFEQSSRLSQQAIHSIEHFDVIGIYVLEPAEPAPPMNAEDIRFEQFQAEYAYKIKEELDNILRTRRTRKMQGLINALTSEYGHREGKISFVQTIRSKSDYYNRHSLNVAILATMIAYERHLRIEDCEEIITAAICHDIGKIELGKKEQNADEAQREAAGHVLLGDIFTGSPNIRRMCQQSARLKADFLEGRTPSVKPVEGCKVLTVAEYYDSMTAVNDKREHQSEVVTVKTMLQNPSFFDPETVQALSRRINIVIPGVSVELNTGDKALVLAENKDHILRPTVLVFRNNQIVDLNKIENRSMEIVDLMKTLDNRCIMRSVKAE